MNLFTSSKKNKDRQKLQQIKAWIAGCFQLELETPISINQLQCHEPGCPDVETIIALMTSPPQKYKVSKSIAEITEQDISLLADN